MFNCPHAKTLFLLILGERLPRHVLFHQLYSSVCLNSDWIMRSKGQDIITPPERCSLPKAVRVKLYLEC